METGLPTSDRRGSFSGGAVAPGSVLTPRLSPQIYPDEGHFLHGDGARQHLSQSLVNFFEECFRKPEKREEDGDGEENDS